MEVMVVSFNCMFNKNRFKINCLKGNIHVSFLWWLHPFNLL